MTDTKKISLIVYPPYSPLEKGFPVLETFLESCIKTSSTPYVAAPYPLLSPLHEKLSSSEAKIGSILMLDTSPNAFTGPIAAKMLQQAKASFVLINSLEEQKTTTLDSKQIHNKAMAALSCQIIPIICIAETEQQSQEDDAKERLTQQLTDAIKGFSKEELASLHILYDASWIYQAPWHREDVALQQAYQRWQEVTKEVIDSDVAPGIKLIYPIPSYSLDVEQIISSLSAVASGYSFGYCS